MTDLTDTGELLDGPPPLAAGERLAAGYEVIAHMRRGNHLDAYEVIKGPRPVVILETLTGATLAYLIDTAPRRLAIPDIVHLGLHLCSALHYLHRHDVLHLDLKPSNIVSDHGLAKLLDLSIARSPGWDEK